MSRQRRRSGETASGRTPGRRAVLAALASGVALAGCSGAPGSGDGSDPGGDEDPDDGDSGAASSPEPTDTAPTETPTRQPTGWPQFRADPANTGYVDRSGPRGDAVRWRIDLPSVARAPVAVADGTAYVLTADGGLGAYRIEDGREEWQATLRVAPTTSPAVTDVGVFLATDSGVARVSREGDTVWQRDLSGEGASLEPPEAPRRERRRPLARQRYASGSGADPAMGRRQASPPDRASVVVSDDRLYTAIGSDVVALGTDEGGTLWRTGLESAPGTPAVGEDGELRVSTERHVVGLDLGGTVGFRTEVGDGLSAPAVADGVAYVAAGQGGERMRVVAVGPAGDVQWRTTPGESDVEPNRLEPVAGRLSRTGGPLGSRQIRYTPSSAPAVGPDGVYVGTPTGVAALARDGRVRWRTALEGVEGDPVVVGDRVYAATDLGVVVLDRANGTERQRTALGSDEQAAASAPRGRFAAARFQVETGPTASPAVADGVYVPVNRADGGAALVAVD